MVLHNIAPVYNAESKILILGSFPSVKSRESGFFYGHPQNRFWKVIATIFGEAVPVSIEEKKDLLLRNGVAVWDVLSSCEIVGSSDSTIRNAKSNDVGRLLECTKIERIFVNGKTAEKYYVKYIEPQIKVKAICLPSTSPANAVMKFEQLVEKWSIVK